MALPGNQLIPRRLELTEKIIKINNNYQVVLGPKSGPNCISRRIHFILHPKMCSTMYRKIFLSKKKSNYKFEYIINVFHGV